MTGQELVDDCRSELLERVAGFFGDDEMLRWLNQGERDFSNRVRGFEDVATLSVQAGQSSYPLPANWLSAVAIFFNNKVDGIDSWSLLEPTDLQEMAAMHPNFLSPQNAQANDVPNKFFIWNRMIYLYKTPGADGDRTLLMYYKAKPVSLLNLTQSINTDDTLSGAIRAYIMWKAWTKEKELAMADEQKQLYYAGVRDGLRDVKLRALNKLNNLDVRSSLPLSQVRSHPNRGWY